MTEETLLFTGAAGRTRFEVHALEGRVVIRDAGTDAELSSGDTVSEAIAALDAPLQEVDTVEHEPFEDVIDWLEPVATEGLVVWEEGEPKSQAVRGLDGVVYLLPRSAYIDDHVQELAHVDAARDSGGPVTWDDTEQIVRSGDLYIVTRWGDRENNVVPVGRFDREVDGLRAAAEASEYFDFDEETGGLVQLVDDYDG